MWTQLYKNVSLDSSWQLDEGSLCSTVWAKLYKNVLLALLFHINIQANTLVSICTIDRWEVSWALHQTNVKQVNGGLFTCHYLCSLTDVVRVLSCLLQRTVRNKLWVAADNFSDPQMNRSHWYTNLTLVRPVMVILSCQVGWIWNKNILTEYLHLDYNKNILNMYNTNAFDGNHPYG